MMILMQVHEVVKVASEALEIGKESCASFKISRVCGVKYFSFTYVIKISERYLFGNLGEFVLFCCFVVIGSDNEYDVFRQNRCLDLPPSERSVAFLSEFNFDSVASKWK